jgi:hypothetical protein
VDPLHLTSAHSASLYPKPGPCRCGEHVHMRRPST